ncbi:MAG: CopG family transcriptional regulator [Actinobacteria bacterium]|nr:CopG family transcriptional regulator [Cyanobacteriota bacterium]MCL5770787.1 CopG family transcriptional regulator [Actinomycetota bacterium]
MDEKIIIRVDKNLKNDFTKLARMEGKTTSDKVRELMADFVAENDFSKIIDDLWSRISEKIENKGFSEKDIDKAIEEVRKK